MNGEHRPDRFVKPVRSDRWIEDGLRPVLIAAMLACLAALLVRLLRALIPGWPLAYFPALVFLACLEGVLSERRLRSRHIAGRDYLVSRAAELAVYLLLLKLANTLALGPAGFLGRVQHWLAAPEELVTPADLMLGGALVVLWAVSLQVAQVARELDQDAGRGPPPADKASAAYYVWQTQPVPTREREAALAELGSLVLWGGVLALLVAALAYRLGPAYLEALPLMLYFALGLALMTQGRFGVARSVWQAQDVPVQPNVGRRWLLWAAVFLLGISLLALLLPTRYAELPIALIRGALAILARLLTYLAALILFFLTMPLALLFPNLQTPQRPELPDLAQPLPPAETGAGLPPWLHLAGLAVVWLAAVAVLTLLLLRFWRDRWGRAAGRRRAEGVPPWWHRLWAWLHSLRRRSAAWRADVRRRAAGRRRAAPAPGAPARWLSLRRLAPVERVRFFYLSTVRRAAQAGQPRAPSQTPYEYRSSLDGQFPDLEPDLGGLTEAFVDARYGRRPVEAGQADAAKPLWQRLQAALRRRRGKPQMGTDDEG